MEGMCIRTVANNNATHLVFGYRPVHDEREAEQHPRQIRRLEDNQPQKAKKGVRVLSAPDVDQRAR